MNKTDKAASQHNTINWHLYAMNSQFLAKQQFEVFF